MLYDEALYLAGDFGRYQCFLFLISNIFNIGGCLHNLCYVFIAALPDHWCKIPELDGLNLTVDEVKQLTIPMSLNTEGLQEYSHCEMYDRPYANMTREMAMDELNRNATASVIGCQHGWVYDRSVYESSISMEWDLVCEKRALAAASQSVYMAGLMVGVLLFGSLSDMMGRRRTLYTVVGINVITFILTGFSVNFTMFLIVRFLVAFSSIAMFTTTFVLFVEMVGPDWRTFVGIIIEYFWVGGFLVLGALAYALPNWRHLQMAMSFPALICIPILFLFPESPRWLFSKGRTEEGMALLRKIAKYNKKTLPDKVEVSIEISKGNVFVWDICRHQRLRLRTAIVYFTWFVCSMVYYGLSLNTSNLGGNDYVNFILSGLIELPAYAFCHVTLNRLGRRPLTVGSMLLGGVALLLTLAVPGGPKFRWLMITLVMVGKFGISAAFAILYIYSAEIFPTVVRNSALGSASFFARIGGIIAPQMGLLSEVSKYIPLVTFGTFALVSGLACLALPETSNTVMPETLKDGENFRRRNSTFLPPTSGDEEPPSSDEDEKTTV